MKKIILILSLLISTITFAQQYSIDWYKIAGGGGTSSNGQYVVSGTIGQHDASGAMTGGNYSLTGGFWSLFAIQTPGAPLLTITYSGNKAVVSWPSPSASFLLQTNGNLATPNWVDYGGTISDNGTIKSVTNGPSTGNLFFRLHHP